MEISSVNQARVFLWMIVCGAVCTFVFDVFRGIRRYKSPQNSVILLQDLVLPARRLHQESLKDLREVRRPEDAQ